MRRIIPYTVAGACLCLWSGGHVDGRGFGGVRAGGFGGYGGYRGGVEGYRGGGFGSYSGARSFGGYEGYRGGAVGGTYDRTWTGDRGGSVNVSGDRGAVYGPYGGRAAGGQRDVTATGPEGRTYSSERAGGVAVGPYGRTVGGVAGRETATGARGWESAYGGTRFATDAGLAHYSAFGAGGVAHVTNYWSGSYMTTRAGYVRTGFGYYNCFRPNWYARYPGCWYFPGWAAGFVWTYPTWNGIYPYLGFVAQPYTYDYGNDIVFQNNTVYVAGQSAGTPEQFAEQAITLADAGVQANAPASENWKPLGVFALVQGDDKTSNNVFQLAVNKDGIIRGNYYDGVADTNTEVYGSVDKKTQRAAWTIGKKKDRVFEAGIYNLTQPEAPCLVHLGTERTQQMLLVRMDAPKDGPGAAATGNGK